MSALGELHINSGDLAKAIQRFNGILPLGKNDFYECDFLLSRIMTPNATITSYPLHQHSFYELHIPISGKAEYWVAGEDVCFAPQKAVLLPPNQAHRLAFSENYVSLTLGFVFTRPASLCSHAVIDKEYREIECSLDVLHCISYILRVLLDRSGEDRYLFNTLFSVIIHDIFMRVPEFRSRFKRDGTVFDAERVSDDARTRIALQYIADNIAFPISAGDVANHLSLSSRQLNRILKSSTDLSVNRLINEMRIKEAKRRIEQTDLSLSEIALLCGFNSPTHFNLTFKKLTGITPTLYRQRTRAKEYR